MRQAEGAPRPWWGEFEIPVGGAGSWQLGPLLLDVARLEHEWRTARRSAEDDELCSVQVPGKASEEGEPKRYVASAVARGLRLLPVLPDLPVVTRTLTPLIVPEGGEVTLYVGSPVWVRLVELGSERLLDELPTVPPTRTWFGPSPREGEIAYASATHGRVRLADLVRRPHRVITPVRIENHVSEALELVRVSLPVRSLSLYAAGPGELWTEPVTLDRTTTRDLAQVRIVREPPPEAPGAERVSEPRDQVSPLLVVRAFSSLFR